MAGHACASLRILRMVTLSRWITKEGEHSNPVLRSFIASTRHGLFLCNTNNAPRRDSRAVHNGKGRLSKIRLLYDFIPRGYEIIPRGCGIIRLEYLWEFNSLKSTIESHGNEVISSPAYDSGYASVPRIRGDGVCSLRIRCRFPQRRTLGCRLRRQGYGCKCGRGTICRD